VFLPPKMLRNYLVMDESFFGNEHKGERWNEVVFIGYRTQLYNERVAHHNFHFAFVKTM